MPQSQLPSEEQRIALCDLMHNAFIELRYLDGEQAHDLAYAFHNLPKEMYGWGSWSSEGFISRLRYYQSKHAENIGFNYVSAAETIFHSGT
ncbi:hypothetical protein [Pseudomonas mangrovi]|uniref:hypothetical protein n=1 Tax=Pseudomonas mangrovi TaxID=2161748 RepID=UPI0011B22785|nr:hypothetical protein [Pseudomonas mangrovi]